MELFPKFLHATFSNSSMEMRSHFIYLFIIFIYFSCSNDKINHNTFRRSEIKFEKLEGELIQVDSINRPEEILLIPEKNLVILRDRAAYLAKAFDLESFTLLKRFVKYGEGPDEQLNCFSFQYDKKQSVIFTSDLFKQSVFSYPVDSFLIEKSNVKPNNVFKVNTQYLYKPIVLNDTIISLRDNNKGEKGVLLNFFHKNGSLLYFNGTFPDSFLKYDAEDLHMVTTPDVNLSEDLKYLIASYYSTDIIDLLDKNGNLLNRIQGPDLFETNFLKEFVGEGWGYSPEKGAKAAYVGNAKMKNGNLYILYKGIFENPNDYHAGMLFHFNEQLQLQHAYNLSEPIFDFDIDWDSMILYGLTHNYENKIMTYSLKRN